MAFLGGNLGKNLAAATTHGRYLAPPPLSFDLGSFTNITTRYMMIKNPGGSLWKMSGPFTSGILATDIIGGKRFGQFHSAGQTVNKDSEDFDAGGTAWTNFNANVTNDVSVSPIGTATFDKIYEDANNSAHYIDQDCGNADGASVYFGVAFVELDELNAITIRLTGNGFTSVNYGINLSTKTVFANEGLYKGYLELVNGLYCIYVATTSVAVNTARIRLILCEDDGTQTYLGDGSSGLNLWGINLVKTNMLSPYIYAGAVAGTTNADQFHWTEAVINASALWIRSGFECTVAFSHATDEMAAAAATEFVIADFATTGAKGHVRLLYDGADKKFKWDDDDGCAGESAAVNNNLGDQVVLTWTLDDGANSSLKVVGGGLNATYTSAQTAAADGPLHYGNNAAQALQFDPGHLSEPRPLK